MIIQYNATIDLRPNRREDIGTLAGIIIASIL